MHAEGPPCHTKKEENKMKNLRNRKYGYCAAVILAASAIAGTTPMTAFATLASKPDENYAVAEPPVPDITKDMSPEFAYSADKWASLRDNVMEYGELADLIHEYNPTVRSNRSTLSDKKNQDLTDINNKLWDDAMDLWNAAGDVDTSDYAGRMSAALTNSYGDNLAKAADQNYMDADMYKINYAQAEANLVYQAQQMMATYKQSAYAMENLNANRSLAQASYEATAARQAAGMATQTDVLSALKNVQDIDASILSAQKSADNVRRSLLLMLGWAADAQPDIRDVPEPDLNRIAGMNPDADREQALANNYEIKYNEHKIQNLKSNDLVASTNAELDAVRDKVYSGLKTQYNAVLDARDALETANMKLQLEEVNMNTAAAKAAVGDISQLELTQQQTAYTTARNGVKTSEMQLFLAMEQYDWIKKGLTFQ